MKKKVKKIENYKVVTDYLRADFNLSVQVAIVDGWQPFGSLCVTETYNLNTGDMESKYSQAMVIYEKK